MRSTTSWKHRTALLAAIVLLVAAAASVDAFVPSCEDELAQAYPAELKADLSACDAPEVRLAGDPGIATGPFSEALTGAWRLRSRTQQGITINLEDRTADLYFDLKDAGERLVGGALLIDRPKDRQVLASDDSVAVFWGVEGAVQEGASIRLKMHSNVLGTYSRVDVRPSEAFDFVQHRGVFVSGGSDGASWDRVVLMEGSLTFVSCQRGVVERFVRLSDETPKLEGVGIDQYWQRLQDGRRVAAYRATSASATTGSAR